MPNQRVVIITHGFNGYGGQETLQSMKNAFLQIDDYNVIIVDWSALSEGTILHYPFVAGSVDFVGKKVGDLVRTLMKHYGLKSSKVHLIGHSLGAHVMGRAGAALKARNILVSRISGLDPAKPLFEIPEDIRYEGLDDSVAEFVDVIHTDIFAARVIGTRGHVDFYPNGGHTQPGCYPSLVGL